MRTIRLGIVFGAVITSVLVSVLSLTVGLGMAGWLVGLTAGWAVTGLLATARVRSERPEILPADWVTLVRAVLAAGVAGLVADSFVRPVQVAAVVVLTAVALALDAVDGPVARRTGSVTAVGARFDGEVDAFLILVLSVGVSRHYGLWVLAIGAARYAFLAAGWAVRWLADPLPPRYWGKVVAAVQGIVLIIALSGVLPRRIGMLAVGIAMLLLAESFGHSVVWLYRRGAGPRARRALRRSTAVLAAIVVWLVLVAPDRLDRLEPAAFARIPVEALALVAMGLVVPRRPRRIVAVVAGAAFGLITIIKILDMGFYEELGRPFDPVLDWGNLAPAIGVVRDSIGAAATDAALLVVGLALALVVALVAASAAHLSAVTARHRRGSACGATVLGGIWVACSALSLQLMPGTPIASVSTAGLAVAQVRDASAALHDQRSFEAAIHGADPYRDLAASDLLTGLRGKDVIVAFVESYGETAVHGTSFSPGVDAVLRSGTTALADAGFSARSAYLNSPTFGGLSWLAHSTLQSGLWVASQQRFNQLMNSDRFTLSDAFRKAGWRTVSDNPADWRPWPDGKSFYHYDKLYGTNDVGYRGPTFSWAKVPDQYTLAAFQRLELAPGHSPVMAEIDLVSSHTPWTPLPRMVPRNSLGDGSIFDPMPAQGLTPAVAWRSPNTVRALYGRSIQYSLQALISWVTQVRDDNLVLLVLGDHQPATIVSGADASHLVPVSLITHDPGTLLRTIPWHWQKGLLPSRAAPRWSMDSFRNRFLDAFSTAAPPSLALRPSR